MHEETPKVRINPEVWPDQRSQTAKSAEANKIDRAMVQFSYLRRIQSRVILLIQPLRIQLLRMSVCRARKGGSMFLPVEREGRLACFRPLILLTL